MITSWNEVSIIIPAYNEARNIGKVLDALTNGEAAGASWEVIVVDDGSQDDTASVVSNYRGVKLISHGRNMGKGAAIVTGARNASHEVVLLLDADLINLTGQHARDLVAPVLSGEYSMSIGVFTGGRFVTDLAQFLAPFISGQRALFRRDLLAIPNTYESGFGIETLITRWYVRNRHPIKKVLLTAVSHVMKEEKCGIVPGLLCRLRMYAEIVSSLWFS